LEASLLPDHDLLDLWRGKMSLRRLKVLIRHLPPDAPLWGSIKQAEADAVGNRLKERAAAYGS